MWFSVGMFQRKAPFRTVLYKVLRKEDCFVLILEMENPLHPKFQSPLHMFMAPNPHPYPNNLNLHTVLTRPRLG